MKLRWKNPSLALLPAFVLVTAGLATLGLNTPALAFDPFGGLYSKEGGASSSSSSMARSSALSSLQHLSALRPQPAGLWQKGHKSRVRLIAGDTDFLASGASYAGIHVQLDKGWKTYWRSPGDAGVPPAFDWSGSENLGETSISWPVPRKYKDPYSTSIGYKNEIVLPVRFRPKDPSKPVKLRLRFGYGICADICVPGEAKLNLVVKPRQQGLERLLSTYRARVPAPVKSTGAKINGYAFERVDVVLDGKTPHITIDVSVPPDTDKAELFAVASGDFYLPFSTRLATKNKSLRRFRIDLTKADTPAKLRGREISLTLAGDRSGITFDHKIN